jgi:parallel beta-helix repeat protein
MNDGIKAVQGSTVSGNTVRENGEHGLDMSSDTAYRGNTISDNTDGTAKLGINAGGNVCDGSLTCP